jgi:hypothetical protein
MRMTSSDFPELEMKYCRSLCTSEPSSVHPDAERRPDGPRLQVFVYGTAFWAHFLTQL